VIRRREFILGLGGAAAWPLIAHAQEPGKLYRVGFLWDSPTMLPDALKAFAQGLRDLGYVEGRNIAIEYRWAEGKSEQIREMADELVRLKVDAIVAPSSIYTGAAKRATSTIPIIFMSHGAPIETGHVASFARPGGNVTGLALVQTETGVKALELFKEAAPSLQRVAVLFDPATPVHGPGLKEAEVAGSALGLEISQWPRRAVKPRSRAAARRRRGALPRRCGPSDNPCGRDVIIGSFPESDRRTGCRTGPSRRSIRCLAAIACRHS
jgi:ABC transporter substrate binding protein